MKIGSISSSGMLISKNNKEIPLSDFIGDFAKQFIGGMYINFYLNPSNKHFWITPYDGMFIYTRRMKGMHGCRYT